MRVLLMILIAAVLAGCDSRGAQVEECVAAMKRAQAEELKNPYAAAARARDPSSAYDEGRMHLACMRAAYGTRP